MKQVLKVMIVVLCLATSFVSKAVATDEITLTVSSDGPTKDDAVKNALRTAIEQSYGAFVSANTSILNDELVKDEIVTVSNGSIKDYKEISSVKTGDGTYSVTLSATVSLPHLITYAKNHGSECEFAGNTFGMEMKLFELQRENELKALYNLSDMIEGMLPTTMKYELVVGEPKIPDVRGLETDITRYVPIGKDRNILDNIEECEHRICLRYDPETENATVDKKAETHMISFLDRNIDTTMENFYEIPMTIKWVGSSLKSEDEIDKEVQFLLDEYKIRLGEEALIDFERERRDYRGIYFTPCEVMADSLTETLKNKYNSGISSILISTLNSISIPESMIIEYRKKGIKLSELRFGSDYFNQSDNSWNFRNSAETINVWALDLTERIERQFNSFVIVDNTGQKSDFFPQHLLDKIDYGNNNRNTAYYGPNLIDDKVPVMLDRWEAEMCIFGTGLFYDFYRPKYGCRFKATTDHYTVRIEYIGYLTKTGSYSPLQWNIKAYVPKVDIGKYSKFWIEKKSDFK